MNPTTPDLEPRLQEALGAGKVRARLARLAGKKDESRRSTVLR